MNDVAAAGPFASPPRRDAMSASLARNWWAVAVRGAFGVLFGLAALAAPVEVILSLALLFASYLLADGAFAVVAAVRAAERRGRWGLLLAEGVLNLAMGVLVFLFPGGAVLGLVLLTAVWALATGGLMLAAAFRLHASHGRAFLALGGLVSLLFGASLAAAPFAGAVVLTWWLGAYALAFGVSLLVLAIRLRARHAGAAARA